MKPHYAQLINLPKDEVTTPVTVLDIRINPGCKAKVIYIDEHSKHKVMDLIEFNKLYQVTGVLV